MVSYRLALNDILSLPNERYAGNGIVVNEPTRQLMLRIENSLFRLQAMGDDERRELWIRADPGTLEEWISYEKMLEWGSVENYEEYLELWKEESSEDNLWYRIVSASYKDFHQFIVSDNIHGLVDLRTIPYVDYKGFDNSKACDLTKPLGNIADAIDSLVENILSDNGKEYVDFVEKNLPYGKREGTIHRRKLYQLADIDPLKEFDKKKLINILTSKEKPIEYEEMTLRIYIQMWAKCYRALHQNQYEGISDTELFKHSSKGYEALNLDFDLPSDFQEWDDACSFAHCFDVVYARVHLWVRRNETTGKYGFVLGTRSVWNLSQYLLIAETLDAQGIRISYTDLDAILPLLREEDLVEITPYAYRYFQGNGIGEQMDLCLFSEDIQPLVMANTNWKSQPHPTPSPLKM